MELVLIIIIVDVGFLSRFYLLDISIVERKQSSNYKQKVFVFG